MLNKALPECQTPRQDYQRLDEGANLRMYLILTIGCYSLVHFLKPNMLFLSHYILCTYTYRLLHSTGACMSIFVAKYVGLDQK